MTTPAKKAAHRPKLPPGEGKERNIMIRTTQELADKAQRLADAAGISRNAWIESLMRKAKK